MSDGTQDTELIERQGKGDERADHMDIEQKAEQPLERETIVLPAGDLEDRTRKVLDELYRDNISEPHIFQRGANMARIVKHRDRIKPEELDRKTLCAHLVRRFSFATRKSDGDGGTEVKPLQSPPQKVLDNLLSQPGWNFPDLESVARSPVYGRDWRLRTDDGYHPGAKVYVDTGELEIDKPPPREVDQARDLILNDLLVDFPFANDGSGSASASRAHAVGLGLLPFIRPAIDEPVPLHLISAPVHGTGKGKLVQAIANVAIGQNAPETPEAEDDAEWRKRITSTLMGSPTFVLLDNLNQKLDSGSLASALTSRYWSDRRLGATEQVKLRNDAVWVATANNPHLSGEMSRRAVLIRLEPDVEKPWERPEEEFKHTPLLKWVKANRSKLVRAFLTLVEHWKAEGRPDGSADRFGSYPTWANVVGGILECAGIEGFMENRERLHRSANREVEEWKALVEKWWDRHGRAPVYTKQIRQLCEDENLLLEVRGDGGKRSQSIKLGKAVNKNAERVFGDYRIISTSDSHRKTNAYQLEKLE